VSKEKHFDNLDVLRGLAASAVCFFHFGDHGFLGGGSIAHLTTFGSLGVAVFFVISGFVIPLALEKSGYSWRNAGSFLLRRFVRLYPAFLAIVLLAITLNYLSSRAPWYRGTPFDLSAERIISNLTFTADFFGKPWFVPVFWTLGIEAQYYILIAGTFPLLIATSALARLLMVALWIGLAFILPYPPYVTAYCGLFAMGIVAYSRLAGKLTERFALLLFAIAAVANFFSLGLNNTIAGGLTFIAIMYAPPVRIRPLLQLGTISYSLYLVHFLVGGRVINIGERLPANPLLRWGVVIIAFCASVVAAFLLHRWIERPSHEFSRSLKRARAREGGLLPRLGVAPLIAGTNIVPRE
jgi:peptidoglycan/LPS O-acetylase OafA/YrhL